MEMNGDGHDEWSDTSVMSYLLLPIRCDVCDLYDRIFVSRNGEMLFTPFSLHFLVMKFSYSLLLPLTVGKF